MLQLWTILQHSGPNCLGSTGQRPRGGSSFRSSTPASECSGRISARHRRWVVSPTCLLLRRFFSSPASCRLPLASSSFLLSTSPPLRLFSSLPLRLSASSPASSPLFLFSSSLASSPSSSACICSSPPRLLPPFARCLLRVPAAASATTVAAASTAIAAAASAWHFPCYNCGLCSNKIALITSGCWFAGGGCGRVHQAPDRRPRGGRGGRRRVSAPAIEKRPAVFLASSRRFG